MVCPAPKDFKGNNLVDYALRSVRLTLFITSIFLAIFFSAISASINHSNANVILFDSYKLAAENTSKSTAYALKIGDLNLVQARLNDLYSVIQAERLYLFDTNQNNIVSIPTFTSRGNTSCEFRSIVTPVKYDNQLLGNLVVCFRTAEFKISNFDPSTLFWFFLSFGILFLCIFQVIKLRFSEIKILFQEISSLNPETPGLKIAEKDLKYSENIILAKSINAMILRIQNYEKDLESFRISSHLAKLAAQVSHDIRSPLAALNLIYGNLDEIPEEKRLLIRRSVQRINDIANDLLSRGKSTAIVAQSSLVLQPSNCILSVEIDSIVSEKRVEYREKLNIDISFLNSELTYGIFSQIRSTELKRVVSNLINNSVEAISENSGVISISINAEDRYAWIIIQDDGPGIPEHVMSKLGNLGTSFGKENSNNGSGLGIYHAKKTIEDLGGKIFITSNETSPGTTISIKLPRSKPPTWFVEKISLKIPCTIVSLDDDSAIHDLWLNKFQHFKEKNLNINFVSFSSVDQFRIWFFENKNDDFSSIFLIDYEFLGQEKNGIDVIEELKIQSKSILVTSRFDDPKVKNRCENLEIKLIPKDVASFIPIEIYEITAALDYVLIDNDPLVITTWKISAKNKGHRAKFFNSLKNFQKHISTIPKETVIYIDSDLGRDECGNLVKGEDAALSFSLQGFQQIFLTTGHDSSSFSELPYIKGIVGKDPI